MPDGIDEPHDEAFRASGPLPPDDRLWRHPSEMAASSGVHNRARPVVALAAGLSVSLVAVGFFMIGRWTDPDPDTGRTLTLAPVAPQAAVLTSTTDGPSTIGWLGITAVRTTGGLRVTSCQPSSPASTVLETGDVLLRIDRTAMPDLPALSAFLRTARPGQQVDLRVRRAGTVLDLTVVLGEHR